jgi:hypothetical protein
MNAANEPNPAAPKPLPTRKEEKRRVLQLAVGFVAFVVVVQVIAFGLSHLPGAAPARTAPLPPLWLLTLLGAFGVVLGLWWSLKYWKAIDETARRAHLDAWYWGGSAGIGVAAILATIAIRFPSMQLAWLEDVAPSATYGAALGAWALMAVMLTGYGVAWAIWWLRNR